MRDPSTETVDPAGGGAVAVDGVVVAAAIYQRARRVPAPVIDAL